jgi:hypothetical protein
VWSFRLQDKRELIATRNPSPKIVQLLRNQKQQGNNKGGDLDEHDCDMACENYGDAQPTHRFHDLE